ncbi:hypothetical protein ACFCXT_14740 [Streptomyces vinaceus]|uniref:hypothetical protein n=1 Tax=Streptomyces vinaceus TaxID=1960 RepID=UPI0035D5E793
MIFAGSTAAGRSTASSGLDTAVLIEGGGVTFRETIRFEERVVELFVHTRTAHPVAASDRAQAPTTKHAARPGSDAHPPPPALTPLG